MTAGAKRGRDAAVVRQELERRVWFVADDAD
jgi:hypothetical protein